MPYIQLTFDLLCSQMDLIVFLPCYPERVLPKQAVLV